MLRMKSYTEKIDKDDHITYHPPKWDDRGKLQWNNIQCQHQSLSAKAICIQPATKVIPVIFLPGVMGTNLMTTQKGDNKPIWRGDSQVKVFLEWVKKKGGERRELLNPDTTQVDSSGKVNQTIYSDISDNGKTSHGTMLPSRQSRGWGEVLDFSYGKFLSVFQGALLDNWQKNIIKVEKNLPIDSNSIKNDGIISQLYDQLLHTEEPKEEKLTLPEIRHFEQFLFPLHVFGYNWLQDNAESAKKLINYIDKVINIYKTQHGHGLAFPDGQEKVILVTHSMGGLVARYASQVLGANNKILGIVHGVIPDLGSPAAYRRMKIGGRQEGAAGIVMGKSAEELMPVLSRAAAPLQLLPSAKYRDGAPWLTIEGADVGGADLNLPKKDPFNEIYLNRSMWWRLYESDIIDKDEKMSEINWNAYDKLMDNVVRQFIEKLDSLDSRYHSNTYAFYGNKIKSDGTLVWKKGSITYPKNTHESDKSLPNDYRKIDLPFSNSQTYRVTPSGSPGDGTVPIESLSAICRSNGQHIKSVLATKVDHQGAYNVDDFKDIQSKPALQFTLRAIVKMVQEVPSP